jgi:hypothetical protein
MYLLINRNVWTSLAKTYPVPLCGTAYWQRNDPTELSSHLSRPAVEPERSAGTCCAPFLQTTLSNSVNPSLLKPKCATALKLVIPSELRISYYAALINGHVCRLSVRKAALRSIDTTKLDRKSGGNRPVPACRGAICSGPFVEMFSHRA